MTQLTKLTAIFLISVLAFSSCKKDLENLIENDLMFNMDANAFLQNQVQLQFVNANSSASKTTPQPSIKISGKDAQMVFDINGGNKIAVTSQFANLAVSPGKPLSPNAPAVFKIEASAPGFLPYEQEITVTHLDSFLTYTFEMVELNNMPQGITQSTGEINLSNTKNTSIGTINNNFFSGTLSIQSGTTFRDENNNVTSGNPSITWRQFDPKNEVVLSNIPHLIANFTENVMIDKAPSDMAFLPIGFAQLQIKSGTQQITSIGEGLQVEFAIPNGTNARSIDLVLEEGDVMGLFHKNTVLNAWELVAETPIISNGGKLKVAYPVFETGDFAIASRRTRPGRGGGGGGGGNAPATCSSNLGLKFTRANNINTLHYIEVVNGSGSVLASASDVQVFNNGTYNFSTKLPSNVDVTVKVYEYEKASYKGDVLATFGPFSSCTKTTSSRATIVIPEMNPIARFELDTYCVDSKLFYYHDGRIQYKVAGAPDATYKDMGLAKKSGRSSTEIIRNSGAVPVETKSFSFLETDRLVSGTTYTFRTEISGRHKSTRKTVKQVFTRDRNYNLYNGEFSPYTGTSPATYTFQKFNRGYWIAPDNACAIFGY